MPSPCHVPPPHHIPSAPHHVTSPSCATAPSHTPQPRHVSAPHPFICHHSIAYPTAPWCTPWPHCIPLSPITFPLPPIPSYSLPLRHMPYCVHLGCAVGYEMVRCFHIVLRIFDQMNSQHSTSTRLRKGHATDALNNFLRLDDTLHLRHPWCYGLLTSGCYLMHGPTSGGRGTTTRCGAPATCQAWRQPSCSSSSSMARQTSGWNASARQPVHNQADPANLDC